MLNDLILISKIKEGDIKAYEGLFRLYYEPLCRYAVSYVHRMEIAEEIVQDLFYIFWKERDKLPVFQSVKAYLYGAVRNKSLQYIEHLFIREKYREEAEDQFRSKPSVPKKAVQNTKSLKIILAIIFITIAVMLLLKNFSD